MWALTVAVPVVGWAAALVAAAAAAVRPAAAVAVSAAAYAALGSVYALVRAGGYFDGSLLEALLWPTLLLWQDMCLVGLWACPAG